MAIRLPLQTVLDRTFSATLPGADSVAGVVAQTFNLPQDTDNVLMKVYQASISGTGGVSLLFQTSDDGGSTWYDVTRTANITNSQFATSVLSGTAIWASVPTFSQGFKTTVLSTSTPVTGSILTQGSILGVTGQSASSTLAVGSMSGLPIMGIFNRVCLIYTGAVTTNDGVKVQIKANSQSATA